MAAETLSESIFEISSGLSGEQMHFSYDLKQEWMEDPDYHPQLNKHITVVETTSPAEGIESDGTFISTVLPNNIYPSIRQIQAQKWTSVRFFLRYTSFDRAQIEDLKYKYIEPVKQEVAGQVGTYACLTVAAPLYHPAPLATSKILDKAPEAIRGWMNRPPHVYALFDSKGEHKLFTDRSPNTAPTDEDDDTPRRYLDKPEPEDGPSPAGLTVALDSNLLPHQDWEQIEKLYEEFEKEAIRTLLESEASV